MSKYVLSCLVLSCFALTGCDAETVATGPVEMETRVIERDKSELVRAEVRMGAGELNVLAAELREILTIEQSSGRKVSRTPICGRSLRFNDDTPLDIIVHFGTGQGTIQLPRGRGVRGNVAQNQAPAHRSAG